jgi:2-keto-myo-inositol isomerase
MHKLSRRALLKTAGTVSLGLVASPSFLTAHSNEPSSFEYCLNTSTIKGKNQTLLETIETASRAGYDSVELWINEIIEYIDGGNTINSLKKILNDCKLKVANSIGFATWMVDDDEQRNQGFLQIQKEMDILAELGCKRIAAPASGVKSDTQLDLLKVGARYSQLLEVGRKRGVMPQLEFWGSSKVFYHIGQAMMVLAAANDKDGRLLADVFHLFKGGSGFNGLSMLNGNLIEVFHMNDYLSSIPVEKQSDKDRVYPGAGSAPLKQILNDLRDMGGRKILSLELFNPEYWKQDPLIVAKTGIEKMKKLVEMAGS